MGPARDTGDISTRKGTLAVIWNLTASRCLPRLFMSYAVSRSRPFWPLDEVAECVPRVRSGNISLAPVLGPRLKAAEAWAFCWLTGSRLLACGIDWPS